MTQSNTLLAHAESRQDFIAHIWHEGKIFYRDLPWRNVDDPYAVHVSEVMLQQTQVRRVIGYWQRFMGLFPTVDALAAADTALVLEQWQGLGYNRRALALKKAAEICSEEYGGEMPFTEEELRGLPGVGPATAAGIRAFAYQKPSVYIETNVRAVFIHHFFPDRELVKDNELYPFVEETCSLDDPRAWYYALLDYGSHLKMAGKNPARRSAHHTKQSKFEGSRRQKRAQILRCVLSSPGINSEELFRVVNECEMEAQRPSLDHLVFESILSDMLEEGFFKRVCTNDDIDSGTFFA